MGLSSHRQGRPRLNPRELMWCFRNLAPAQLLLDHIHPTHRNSYRPGSHRSTRCSNHPPTQEVATRTTAGVRWVFQAVSGTSQLGKPERLTLLDRSQRHLDLSPTALALGCELRLLASVSMSATLCPLVWDARTHHETCSLAVGGNSCHLCICRPRWPGLQWPFVVKARAILTNTSERLRARSHLAGTLVHVAS